ncbi:MAG: OmpA family protein [Bacteroidetes bacterium]|nr:OmpA family protein [Bacteroidota bacterium]
MKGFIATIFITFTAFYVQAQEISYTVLFAYNKYDIPDSCMLFIIKTINAYPIERVLLEGHCGNIGSKEYNYILSDNRASEVKKLLIQNGIPKESIKKCIGFGKDKPITLNETEAERQLNRRVVMTFYLKPEKPNIMKDTIRKIVAEKKILKKEISKIVDAQIGDQIVLENILFEPGRHFLKEESMEDLENLLFAMKENPNLEVEIQGHVCCTTIEPDGFDWDAETNNLSEMRARQIYFLLIKNGIDKKRLRYKGYGGSRKINLDESTEALRRINRRVEIKITHK